MKRQLTKTELLEKMSSDREKLEQLLVILSEEEMTNPGVTETSWAVKDVLVHLFEWEQLCLGWYNSYLQGKYPSLPAEGYKWNQLPALNHQFFMKNKQRLLAEVLEEYQASYAHMHSSVMAMTEEELVTVGYYPWCGKWTVGNFIEASTASHYRWALRLIRKWVKQFHMHRVKNGGIG